MSLCKTLTPLHSTGSTQEDRRTFQHDRKIVDWDVSIKQTNIHQSLLLILLMGMCLNGHVHACQVTEKYLLKHVLVALKLIFSW